METGNDLKQRQEMLLLLWQFNQQGLPWLIAEMQRAGLFQGHEMLPPRRQVMPPVNMPGYLRGARTLGDAVVAAIVHFGKFVSARAIVDAVRAFPAIANEPDERMKRRKVSQALYVQSTQGTAVSMKKWGSTWWGLPAWYDKDMKRVAGEHLPDITNDPNDEDDE
jgi:hypothetical protein